MLMFISEEDGNLELLARGRSPRHRELIYGEAPYYPIDPSVILASGGACLDLNP
jgi:hypothetical protein